MESNKITEELKPRISFFLEFVKMYFSFLQEFGYLDIEERIAEEYVVKNIVEVRYKNKFLNQIVNIHFEPIDIDNNPINLINLFILRNEGIEKLNFELYINKYYPQIDTTHLSYPKKNEGQTLKTAIQISCAGYSYLLKDIGLDLLNGLEWEDGLIHTWSSASEILYKEQIRILRENNKKR